MPRVTSAQRVKRFLKGVEEHHPDLYFLVHNLRELVEASEVHVGAKGAHIGGEFKDNRDFRFDVTFNRSSRVPALSVVIQHNATAPIRAESLDVYKVKGSAGHNYTFIHQSRGTTDELGRGMLHFLREQLEVHKVPESIASMQGNHSWHFGPLVKP